MSQTSDNRLTKETDGFVRRILTRRISIRFTLFLIKYFPSISPMAVTSLALITGIASAFVYSIFVYSWFGGIILFLSAILDNIDGELARALNKESKSGRFLDALFDRCVDAAVIVSITFVATNSNVVSFRLGFFIGFLALLGSFLVSYTACKAQLDTGVVFKRTLEGRDTRIFVLSLSELLSPVHPIIIIAALIFVIMTSFSAVLARIVRIIHISEN